MRLGVLADDLTGAFDTGVQFRNWGLNVEVLIKSGGEPVSQDVDVVVIDTESRYITPEEAQRRVSDASKVLVELGAERIYKKVDSTLRGNIGAEIDAAMKALSADHAFLAPAYPTYGRTTLAGKQLIDNAPLEKTEYVDEIHLRTSEVKLIVNHQCDRKVGLVGFETIKAGPAAIRDHVDEMRGGGVEIIIFDALTEKDLIDIARAAGETRLFVGSAGLAAELPLGLGMKSTKPILSVCGSTRKLSRLQVKNLVDRLGFKSVDINVAHLIDGEGAVKEEVERCVGEAAEAIKAGVDVSITSSPLEASYEEFIAYANTRGITGPEARLFIEEALGMITSAIVAEADVLGLALTGGATSLKVCEKLGTRHVRILEEVEPGIPLVLLSNGKPAVTKAGGFGVEDSLVQAVQRLRRRHAF